MTFTYNSSWYQPDYHKTWAQVFKSLFDLPLMSIEVFATVGTNCWLAGLFFPGFAAQHGGLFSLWVNRTQPLIWELAPHTHCRVESLDGLLPLTPDNLPDVGTVSPGNVTFLSCTSFSFCWVGFHLFGWALHLVVHATILVHIFCPFWVFNHTFGWFRFSCHHHLRVQHFAWNYCLPHVMLVGLDCCLQ